MGYKRVSEQVKAKVVSEFRDGVRVTDLAKKYGKSKGSISTWIKNAAPATGGAHVSEPLPQTEPERSPLEMENDFLWDLIRRQIREGKLRLN